MQYYICRRRDCKSTTASSGAVAGHLVVIHQRLIFDRHMQLVALLPLLAFNTNRQAAKPQKAGASEVPKARAQPPCKSKSPFEKPRKRRKKRNATRETIRYERFWGGLDVFFRRSAACKLFYCLARGLRSPSGARLPPPIILRRVAACLSVSKACIGGNAYYSRLAVVISVSEALHLVMAPLILPTLQR